jgi:uncharacterized protein with PQ loop repeat
MTTIDIIGFVGSALVIGAYIPQIRHLIQEHCSVGISRMAYAVWLVAALFLLAHAAMIRDAAFIFLQAANTVLTAVILAYAEKYKNGVCPVHRMGKNPF